MVESDSVFQELFIKKKKAVSIRYYVKLHLPFRLIVSTQYRSWINCIQISYICPLHAITCSLNSLCVLK